MMGIVTWETARPLRARVVLLTPLACVLITLTGCLHQIHVAPEPDVVAVEPIPRTLRVAIGAFTFEGADHMPGIALLEWRAQDFRQAVIDYIEKRRSFSAVGIEPADLTLSIKMHLAMESRERYIYTIRMDSSLSSDKQPTVTSYVTETQIAGSAVRWVTASDQEPIAEAVRLALNELLTKIEADRERLLKGRS